jgi:hypothetical protein
MNLVIKTMWSTKEGQGNKIFLIEDVPPDIVQIDRKQWEKDLDNAVNGEKSYDNRTNFRVLDIEMMFDVDELKEFVRYEFPDEPKFN